MFTLKRISAIIALFALKYIRNIFSRNNSFWKPLIEVLVVKADTEQLILPPTTVLYIPQLFAYV